MLNPNCQLLSPPTVHLKVYLLCPKKHRIKFSCFKFKLKMIQCFRMQKAMAYTIPTDIFSCPSFNFLLIAIEHSETCGQSAPVCSANILRSYHICCKSTNNNEHHKKSLIYVWLAHKTKLELVDLENILRKLVEYCIVVYSSQLW